MKALEKDKAPVILEALLLIGILCFGAWTRFYTIKDVNIQNFHPDEPRIALGSASILHYRTPILCFESSHEPPLSLYFPIPFFLMFGWDLWVIRLVSILYNLAAIAVIYLFGREYFSWRAGAVAALMSAALPFVLYFSRVMVEHSFLPFLMACMLYGYARHLRTGSARSLYCSAFFMGLGLSTKIVCLYFIAALLPALLISGEFRRIRIEKRQVKTLAAWFLIGAAPFLVFAVLSRGLIPILLSAAHGGGVGHSAGYFAGAFIQRLASAGKDYTPAVIIAPLAWFAAMLLKKTPYDSRPVFLFVLSLGVVLQSTVTISGLFSEQVFLMLPVFAVLAASMVDIPRRSFPELSVELTGAVLAAIMIAFFYFANFNEEPTLKQLKNMRLPLEKMDVRRSMPTTRDVAMAHRYLDFIKTGEVPEYRVSGVTSLSCNRFKRCEFEGDILRKLTYPNLIEIYKGYLNSEGGGLVEDFVLRDPGFAYTPARVGALRNILAWLFTKENYEWLLVDVVPRDQELYPGFSDAAVKAMEDLKNEGLVNWSQKRYVKDGYGFIVITRQKASIKAR